MRLKQFWNSRWKGGGGEKRRALFRGGEEFFCGIIHYTIGPSAFFDLLLDRRSAALQISFKVYMCFIMQWGGDNFSSFRPLCHTKIMVSVKS